MRTFYALFIILCMAVTSGCVKEASVEDCVPGDDFNCVSDDSGNGGDTGTPTPTDDDEVCNDGVDNDNDGDIDCADSDCAEADNCQGTTGIDNDNDGYTDDVDCNDNDESINPGADEVCDSVDNDCDGNVDNDATDAVTYFADNDGDGYGNDDNGTITACVAPEGFVVSNDDCDDSTEDVNPGASEVCDNLTDNDCDGDVGCADGDCDGQVAATVSFDIGNADTDDNPTGTAYWEDNSYTSEAIGLTTPGLPGFNAELTCGEDTYFVAWVLTDSISVTASTNVSIFMDGYSFDEGMDTSTGDWYDHTSYSATPGEEKWFNLYVCIADCD